MRLYASFIALIVLLFAILGCEAQCPSGKYGDGCLCNSPVGQYNADCIEEGVWMLRDETTTINNEIDLKFDEVRGANVVLGESGRIIINLATVENSGNHVVINGRFVLSGSFEFEGNMLLNFMDLTYPGNYTINLIDSDGPINPPNPIETSMNQTFQHCRELGDLNMNDFSNITLEIVETQELCRVELSDASWVLYTFIACSVLAFILIVFALVSCFVIPVKRKTWYPKL